MATSISLRAGGSSVEYKLAFTKNGYVNSVMVNGIEVESGYILKNADIIIVDTAGRTMKVNGVSYYVGTTISLSDTDIQLEFTVERSTDEKLYTINFSIT